MNRQERYFWLLAMTKDDLIDIEMGFIPWHPGAKQITPDYYFSMPDNFVYMLTAILITDAAINLMMTEIYNDRHTV